MKPELAAAEFLRQTVIENPFIPWREELDPVTHEPTGKKLPRPHPRQAQFLLLPHKEALYGGAAGGGKSDALLMAALQYVDVPGYAALILRRTYTDLAKPGSLIPRSHEWLEGTGARYSDTTHTWAFPSGAKLSFGYLKSPNDKYHYQSAEFQFIAFDELTQFREEDYRYMFSRLRRLQGVKIPLRMRAASNPGGIGHEWVRRRFFLDEGRVFVPAKLEDNPSLDQEEYELSLAELDPITREQLRYGRWDARPPGELFSRDWFEIIPLEELPLLAKLTRLRYWDLAATKPRKGKDPDWTAGALCALDKEGRFYVIILRRTRDKPLEVENLVRQCAREDTREVPVWLEQEPGSGGVNTIDNYNRKVLPEYNVQGHRKTGSKWSYWQVLSSKAAAGLVYLVEGPWVSAFLDEAEAVKRDDSHAHDDMVDAVAGAYDRLQHGGSGLVASWLPQEE